MDRKQLLQRIDRAWDGLLAAYSGLSPSVLVEPGVSGSWSIKDIIAHVTWWEEEALTHLPSILRGEKPPRYSITYGGIDPFNAQKHAEKKDLPLALVLQGRDRTHRRLIEFLLQVPEAEIERETRFRRRLRLDTYGHYPLHAEAIREWLRKK